MKESVTNAIEYAALSSMIAGGVPMSDLSIRTAAVVLTLLGTSVSAQAPSPRKQLKLLVEQLQSAPEDDDLRRKIIKLAQKVKPLPALPSAAIEAEGRGKFRFTHAKSTKDYPEAAKEYEKATDAAPWVLGYYSDLCMINEKAEKYAAAKRACELYLLGLTEPDIIGDTKSRIAGLELGIEKTADAKQSFEGWWQESDIPLSIGIPLGALHIHRKVKEGSYQVDAFLWEGSPDVPSRKSDARMVGKSFEWFDDLSADKGCPTSRCGTEESCHFEGEQAMICSFRRVGHSTQSGQWRSRRYEHCEWESSGYRCH